MLVVLFAGCGEANETPESDALKRAKEINAQTQEASAQFEDQLASLRQQFNDEIGAAGDDPTSQPMKDMQTLDSLAAEFDLWKEGFNAIVLPGAACNHDHADGEHHHHHEETEGTDQDHLEVQLELSDELARLQAALNQTEN